MDEVVQLKVVDSESNLPFGVVTLYRFGTNISDTDLQSTAGIKRVFDIIKNHMLSCNIFSKTFGFNTS